MTGVTAAEAAETPVKYERDLKYITYTLSNQNSRNRKNSEKSFSNPQPRPSSCGLR